MRLIFVRHGSPDYKNDCLTEEGHIQARQAAKRLEGEGITRVYSSSCGRAYETAQYTAAALGLEVIKLDFMREIQWGSIDGTPIFANGQPWKVTDKAIREGVDFFNKAEEDRIWTGSKISINKVMIGEALDEWLETLGYKREGQFYGVVGDNTDTSVALFSHGGSSTAALAHLLNLPFAYLCTRLCPDLTAVTILSFGNEKGELVWPYIELANDARHIKSNGISYGQ